MFWSFNRDVCSAMNNNQFTIAAHSASENAWGTGNLNLNNDWLHNSENPDTGKNSQAESDVAAIAKMTDAGQQRAAIDKLITGINPDGKNPDGTTSPTNADFANDDWWSMDLIIQLQGLVGKCYDKDTDSSLQSSAVQQEASLIQSDMAKGTSTSDSEMQAMSSLIGNDASAITPQSNSGDSVTGVLGNSSTAQASISA